MSAIGVWPTLVKAEWIYQPEQSVDLAEVQYPWRVVDQVPTTLTLAERLSVQKNFLYHALLTPTDPQFSLQWNFQSIDAPAAWDVDQQEPLNGGDPGVVVAVLDTGVAFENYSTYVASPEISTQRIWVNSRETIDGLDNDSNGFIDDLNGWDFVNNDAHPNDDHGHGTHIAGTILGQTNNGVAVAGLAWHSTLLPLKVLDNAGDGSTSTITAAIYYAIEAGADVINLSLGGNSEDPVLRQAIQAAVSRGIVIIAAAGNDGSGALNYPARYSEVIAVGATQYDNTRVSYSNYGDGLDLMAPGGNTTLDQNSDGQPDGIAQQTCTSGTCAGFDTYYYTGTSQAAAHVAGAAALLLSCGSTGGTIANLLTSTATDLGVPGADAEYGHGLLNLGAAMSQVVCSGAGPVAPSAITATSSATTTRTIRPRDPAPFIHPVFRWTGSNGAVYQVQWGKQGATAATTTQTDTTFRPTLLSQGLYQLTVRVVDSLGRVSEAQTFFYRFRRATLALGQGGDRSTVTLVEPGGRVVRTFSARIGNVTPAVSGTVTSRQSLRLVISGQDAGNGVAIVDTRGTRLSAWRPFGAALSGGVSTAGIRQLGQDTLVAVTGTNRGATVRWMTMSGQRIRSIKTFANHDRGLTMTPADLNGDGTDEVVVAKNGGSLMAAYDIAGRQLWQRQPHGKSWRGVWSLTAIDRNNDGRDEIAVGGLVSTGATKIIIVSGSGTSLSTWTLRPSQNPGQVDLAAADLNGNGTEELLSIPRRGRGVVDTWSPTGRRSTPITFTNTTTSYRLTVLD